MPGVRRKNLVAANELLIFLISYSRFQVSFHSPVPKFVFIILKLQYQINNIAWEVAKANSLVGELSTEVPNECTDVLYINSLYLKCFAIQTFELNVFLKRLYK